jgi:hypothetical protein
MHIGGPPIPAGDLPMKRIILAVVLAMSALQAKAAPLVFTDSTWTTSGFSSAGTASNSARDVSPTTPLPLTTSARSADLDAKASADAIPDVDVLSALATAVASSDGAALAVASSAFLGNFVAPGGLLYLLLDIDLSATSAQGGGFGEGLVRIMLVGGPDLLIDEIVRATGMFDRYFELPFGTAGFLNIEAIASADAPTVGDIAVGSASVIFGLRTVPEPAGLALLLAPVLGAVMASRETGVRGASLRLAA